MTDLISRAAAIDAIFGCFNVMESKGIDMTVARTIVKGVLDEAPAVDAVPVVHGRWIDADGKQVAWSKALPSSPGGSCICSVCDTWLVGSDELPVYGLYCPACGAKMDKGGDGHVDRNE